MNIAQGKVHKLILFTQYIKNWENVKNLMSCLLNTATMQATYHNAFLCAIFIKNDIHQLV